MNTIDKTLRAVLLRHQEIKLATLFGSMATGKPTPESDVDLGVLADNPLDAETKLTLMEEIGQATGRPADIIDLRTAGEPILGQVFKGRRILGDTTLYAERLSRHLIDKADFLPLRILKERRERWTGRQSSKNSNRCADAPLA